MKILFLDIDGVLNSQKSFAINHAKRLAAREIHGGDVFDKQFCHPEGHLDPDAISVLNTIVEQTQCQIVISSTWRLHTDVSELKILLEKKGFKYSNSIVGITPNFNLSAARGFEIHEWLNDHPWTTSFCILDDDGDMWHLLPWHVRTTYEDGLTHAMAEIAIRLLNNPTESLIGWGSIYNYFDCKDYWIWENNH